MCMVDCTVGISAPNRAWISTASSGISLMAPSPSPLLLAADVAPHDATHLLEVDLLREWWAPAQSADRTRPDPRAEVRRSRSRCARARGRAVHARGQGPRDNGPEIARPGHLRS